MTLPTRTLPNTAGGSTTPQIGQSANFDFATPQNQMPLSYAPVVQSDFIVNGSALRTFPDSLSNQAAPNFRGPSPHLQDIYSREFRTRNYNNHSRNTGYTRTRPEDLYEYFLCGPQQVGSLTTGGNSDRVENETHTFNASFIPGSAMMNLNAHYSGRYHNDISQSFVGTQLQNQECTNIFNLAQNISNMTEGLQNLHGPSSCNQGDERINLSGWSSSRTISDVHGFHRFHDSHTRNQAVTEPTIAAENAVNDIPLSQLYGEPLLTDYTVTDFVPSVVNEIPANVSSSLPTYQQPLSLSEELPCAIDEIAPRFHLDVLESMEQSGESEEMRLASSLIYGSGYDMYTALVGSPQPGMADAASPVGPLQVADNQSLCSNPNLNGATRPNSTL